jgi:hypothetical protein
MEENTSPRTGKKKEKGENIDVQLVKQLEPQHEKD